MKPYFTDFDQNEGFIIISRSEWSLILILEWLLAIRMKPYF